MKRLTKIAFIIFSVYALIEIDARREKEKEDERRIAEIKMSRPLTIYEIAEALTGCPADIIEGIRFAESSYGRNIKHPDPLDVGDFGLHEDPEYHADRARKWGEYNALCPLQAAIITGHLYVENYSILGNRRDAIAAHLQGPTGVKMYGAYEWYVQRVERREQASLEGMIR